MRSEKPPASVTPVPSSMPVINKPKRAAVSQPISHVAKKSALPIVIPVKETLSSAVTLVHSAEQPIVKKAVPEIETKYIPDLVPDEAPASPGPKAVVPKPSLKMVKSMPETTLSSPYKGYDNIAAFSKANLEAVVLSNQILTKGLEELSKEVMSISQSSVENATSAIKAIWSARSLQDFIELNADYTKSALEKFMSNSTKLTELSVKVATDALGPVTARVQKAVEKAIKPEIAA